jgi:ABC-type lipoprotein export system ATPase subunit
MFELKNVQPAPITAAAMQQSDVWATDFRLEKGRKYLITAPSGKGKSTFLHLLYGLRHDFKGEITFNEKSLSRFDLETWAQVRQHRLAIVFQDLRLFPDLSGLENIQLKAQLTQHISLDRIKNMAERLGVADILGQSCGTMSYGQRQRIAIIRALCQPFEWLLLDEPFSHLDEANVRAACALIEERCAEEQAGRILVSLGESYFLEHGDNYEL